MSSYIRVSYRLDLPSGTTDAIIGVATRRDEYPVHIVPDDASALERLATELADRRVALITDDTVAALHGRRLAARLARCGLAVAMTSFSPGETNKSPRTALNLLNWLASTALARRDVVLAMGGGVVIDTVGWVASAYMRGVPYINVPTTLLGQVDAAIGGKVAVDHHSAKNLIGAFYQPKAVVSNVSYLLTLDRRQLRAGLAEAIKKGAVASPALFHLIENSYPQILNGDRAALAALVRGASAVKCELIAQDPYEEDLRRPLNFGHTVGHAVETVTRYGPILHGEAVAFGMAVATRIAHSRGLVNAEFQSRIIALLAQIGLPTALEDFGVAVDPDELVAALGQIRKIRDGVIRFVLPVDLGETVIADDVTGAEIKSAVVGLQRTRTGR